MKKTLISISNIVSSNNALVNISVSIQERDKIALIGRNGSGKSTLMKIIAGIEQPVGGTVVSDAQTYYIPQYTANSSHMHLLLYEYLSRMYEEWWKVIANLESMFGMKNIEEQKLHSFSGGERMKIHIALAKTISPSVLLLDEPTNHLDLESMDVLYRFLSHSSSAYVIASHNKFFLDKVTSKIWEVENKQIHAWQGIYTDYINWKKTLHEANARQYEVKKKEIKKIHESLQKETIRAARSKRTGRELSKGRTTDRFATGYFGNKASASAGNIQEKLVTLLEKHTAELDTLKNNVEKSVHLNVLQVSDRKKTLLRIRDGYVDIHKNKLLEGVSFMLEYGERIAISGLNGSGKTAFVKGIMGNDSEVVLKGDIYKVSSTEICYISQTYDQIDPSLSVIENMLTYNNAVSYEDIRKKLAQFLFIHEEDITKNAGNLSGGEAARLVFAMTTLSQFSLLMLDEPTNNLDTATVESIVQALNEFPGGIIVITHDISFLKSLKIEKGYIIHLHSLQAMNTSPLHTADFYEELMNVYHAKINENKSP